MKRPDCIASKRNLGVAQFLDALLQRKVADINNVRSRIRCMREQRVACILLHREHLLRLH